MNSTSDIVSYTICTATNDRQANVVIISKPWDGQYRVYDLWSDTTRITSHKHLERCGAHKILKSSLPHLQQVTLDTLSDTYFPTLSTTEKDQQPMSVIAITKPKNNLQLIRIQDLKVGECIQTTSHTYLCIDDPAFILDLDTLQAVQKDSIEQPYGLQRTIKIALS